jgi:hypothetical protein
MEYELEHNRLNKNKFGGRRDCGTRARSASLQAINSWTNRVWEKRVEEAVGAADQTRATAPSANTGHSNGIYELSMNPMGRMAFFREPAV